MASPAPHLTFRDVLKLPDIRRLWMAQLVSIFGDFLAVFAVFSIVTFDLHGTPFQVAMILVAYFTPIAVIVFWWCCRASTVPARTAPAGT